MPPVPRHATSGWDRRGDGGDDLRLLVVGDSTAAGFGVSRLSDALAGCLARDLAEVAGWPVSWTVAGQFGASARRIRHRILPAVGDGHDIAVLLAGTNDAVAEVDDGSWVDDLDAIVNDLTQRSRWLVVVGTPPFTHFPGLPRMLACELADRGRRLDHLTEAVCRRHAQTVWLSVADTDLGPESFAADRFHPSPVGYRRLARAVMATLPDLLITGPTAE